MSFFDKVKNMFTEEVEDDDIKVEKVEPEIKKNSLENPKKDDGFEQRLRTFGGINDVTNTNQENNVKKPVFFTDKDFDDLLSKPKKEETVELYKKETIKTSYSIKKEEEKKEEKKIFKPTPIISPVYGILDKNYHKEDIVSKKDVVSSTSSDGLSVDSVRNKAYGTLEDELENTLFGKNSILFNDKTEENQENTKTEESDFFEELEKEAEPDVLDELKESNNDTTIEELDEITMDIEKELDSILNKKEKKEDTNNKSEDKLKEDDLFEMIDSMYEGEDK